MVLQEPKELPPSDVLREVAYSGGFGGGGDGCEMLNEQPSVPTIFMDEKESIFEWEEEIGLMACGWKPNESVTFRVVSPTGEIIKEEPVPYYDLSGYPSIYFWPEINTPPGEYRLMFAGQKETLEKRINVIVPNKPRMYVKENSIILYNFQPDEKISLYIYLIPENPGPLEFIANLYDWGNFRANGNGQLVIQVDNTNIPKNRLGSVWYVAIGGTTGEIHRFPQELNRLLQNIYSPYGFLISPNIEPVGVKPKNIWDLLKYKELYSPGKKTYSLAIKPTDVIRWRFAWCTVDQNTLDQNLKNLTVEFWADGVKVDQNLLSETTMVSDNSWPCKRWSSILSNWTSGSKHTLEFRYTLKNTVSDGSSTYQAGDYQQIVNIEVK